ncbi:hypothetical protein QG516_20935 [Pedobacter gandavensis]|uniref:hypothetical protein n=1 Tax=Pedobacter gandavensis TaxID=2679963 RepID=UPI002478A5D0|nr:hypothetical protein [Pedobacter gandavensis]WGQ08981.1 hypothetical protein QG516_20935 [Pedobacter gandavensis]
MYRIIICSCLLLATLNSAAQKIVFDRNHFNIVNENGTVRSAAENTHENYLSSINNKLSDINLNISSVIMVQTLIFNSLTQVNQALRSGIALRQIGEISTEIIYESNKMIQTAASEPYLLLFAEDVARQMKNRGIRLVNDVSAFVLKEGENVLMDYEKRDALLRKIILELRVMRALVYSLQRSMYWAKVNGILKTVNPYKNFINQDTRLVNDILFKYDIIKQ